MRHLFALIGLFFLSFSAMRALPYEEARDRAWFLTDKMAYELNLTEEQYERAYQINLDYLLSINSASDCYGNYWTYRNLDLQCILSASQYSLFLTLDYFLRPVRWLRSAWYFPVFEHYRRNYFYFARPHVYISYRGGSWRRRGHNDPSPYRGFVVRPGTGMRDLYRAGHHRRPAVSRPGRPAPRPEYRPNTQRPPRPSARPHRQEARPDNRQPGRTFGNKRNPSTSTRTTPTRRFTAPRQTNKSGSAGRTGHRIPERRATR